MQTGVPYLSRACAGLGLLGLRQWVASALLLVSALAIAATDLDDDRQLSADRLIADRAQALAAQGRRAEERQQALFAELATKDKALRETQLRAAQALTRLQAAQADQPNLERTRSELATATQRLEANTQERLRLAAEIEQRDRSYQAELAEYRRLILGAVATPNPERLEALQRFADGERARPSRRSSRSTASRVKPGERLRRGWPIWSPPKRHANARRWPCR